MKSISKYAISFTFALVLGLLLLVGNVSAVEVSNFDEYKECMSTENATCDLTADIEDATYFWFAKGTTLNLQEHTISGPSYLLLASSGVVTVNGPGTLETTDSGNGGVVYVYGGGSDVAGIVTVNLNNITVKNDDGWAAFIQNRAKNSNNIYPAYGATINITDSKLECTNGVTILGNFQDTAAQNPPVINITNSTIDVEENAVYAAGYGLYNIIGSTLRGDGALGIKSGTVRVENSKIYGIGAYVADVAGYNDGMKNSGAAIQIELNDGYADHIKLYLTDTEVESENGRAFQQYSAAGSTIAAIKELEINNCKFNSKQSNFGVNDLFKTTKFILGGEYSSLPELAYLKDGQRAYQSNSKHVYVVEKTLEIEAEDVIVISVGEGIKLHDTNPDYVGYSVDYDEDTTEEQLEALQNVVTLNDKTGMITGKTPGTVKYHVYLNDFHDMANVPEKVVTIVVLPVVEVVTNDENIDPEEVISDANSALLNAELGEALKELIATDDEDLDELGLAVKNAVLSGKVVSAQITTNSAEAAELAADVKEEIDKAVSKDAKVVGYYNITIDILVDDQLAGQIDELENKLKITLPVPENLPEVPKGKVRVFTIIRVHGDENETTELKATDNGDGTLSFESDKYSTFAVTYADVDASSLDDTPNTGTIATVGIALMLLSAGAFVVVKAKKYVN